MVAIKALLMMASLTFTDVSETELLCFGANWCAPCKALQPTLDQLQKEGYPLRKIDVDHQSELAIKYRVTSVPTMILVDGNDKVLHRINEPTTREYLLKMFQHFRVGPTANGQRAELAEELFQRTVATGEADPKRANALAQRRAALTPAQERAMASTVRLRVEDPEGQSFGTGTVIDVHDNEALVLTCAHIFREAGDAKSSIVIERFDADAAGPTSGSLISADLDLDVALVSMKLKRPITVSKLADVKYRTFRGEGVFSVGCNHGDDPTVMEGHINDIDKYLGAPNITASGEPVIGRSGGGLFNGQGLLIGVCNAADPEFKEGLYAALPRVCYELDRNGLSYVYQSEEKRSSTKVADETTRPIVKVAAATANAPGAPDSSNDGELVFVLQSDSAEEAAKKKKYVIKNPSRTLIEYLSREANEVE